MKTVNAILDDAHQRSLDKYKPKRRPNGQFEKGSSGHPGGEPGWIRKQFNADFLRAFHEHFRHEGKRVIAKVARAQPAVYLRCLTMLVPKEMKVEAHGGIKAMSDEQLDMALAALRELIAQRLAAAERELASPALPDSTVIDAKPLEVKD